jgi:hypothetical protein
MPFGLANTPAIFQAYINTALARLLDRFVVVYLDNILIYSKNIKEYYNYIRKVLTKLRKNNLFYKLSKYKFNIPKVKFLSFIIRIKGIRADPKQIRSIIK